MLPLSGLGALCELCKIPAPAHKVVAAFKRLPECAADDHSIIVALQLLADNDIVAALDHTPITEMAKLERDSRPVSRARPVEWFQA